MKSPLFLQDSFTASAHALTPPGRLPLPAVSCAPGHDCSGVCDGEPRAASPPRLAGTDAAAQAPRTVTTGGKINTDDVGEPSYGLKGVDGDTGEDVLVTLGSRGIQAVRQLSPDPTASPRAAQVDALAFSVIPPLCESMGWVLDQMRQFLPIAQVEQRNGCSGFTHSARFGDGAGLIAWGGESQRRRVYFSIQGKGCSLVEDWAALAAWLREHQAKLKRADVAYDDVQGQTASIAWAIDQYNNDGFNAGGRKPSHQVFGDWLHGEESAKGRTVGIGNRSNGKYCRIYEKGKQLGDSKSPWTRVEVEWRGKDRLIPVELLTEPGKYLAGAYPCLAHLNVEQARIKTIAHSSTISLEVAEANGKQQAGKLVNLMMQVYGGDFCEVVKRLRRDGVPARIEPYGYHLAQSPELLDPDAPGSFAAAGLLDQRVSPCRP